MPICAKLNELALVLEMSEPLFSPSCGKLTSAPVGPVSPGSPWIPCGPVGPNIIQLDLHNYEHFVLLHVF